MNGKVESSAGTRPGIVRSMTGYGQAAVLQGDVALEIEIRSVNHRYLDLSLKIPREYFPFELELRQLLQERLSRGHVELYVSRRRGPARQRGVCFDSSSYEALYEAYRKALQGNGNSASDKPGKVTLGSDKLDKETSLRVSFEILRRAEILSFEEDELDVSAEKDVLFGAVEQAIRDIISMREREGESLRADLVERVTSVASIRDSIEADKSRVVASIRERLLERIKKFAPEVLLDETRVTIEVAMLAERSDVAEELDRLRSHTWQFTEAIVSGGSCGRTLDFLIQEMNREFNTIASKAQDAGIQRAVVQAKSEIEKMREQVQNLE